MYYNGPEPHTKKLAIQLKMGQGSSLHGDIHNATPHSSKYAFQNLVF